MSAEHDELFQLMLGRTTTKAVERILAAGYGKPQQVTTVEELDALGAKSVIIDANGAPLVCDGEASQPWASFCEDPYGGPIWMDSADVTLPAMVLHVGGAE